MGIEDDFYATVKFKSGEEIFAKVAASEEEDKTVLIVTSPVVVTAMKTRDRLVGYKIEPWLKTTSEDMFIIDIDNVLTLSESSDIEMIMLYQEYLRSEPDDNNPYYKLNRKMGYLGNVNDTKEILEKLYKSN
tara:strand:- start:172 stop:567 length:396 start_codon:yes stop_codon:yes gene_type:complete